MSIQNLAAGLPAFNGLDTDIREAYNRALDAEAEAADNIRSYRKLMALNPQLTTHIDEALLEGRDYMHQRDALYSECEELRARLGEMDHLLRTGSSRRYLSGVQKSGSNASDYSSSGMIGGSSGGSVNSSLSERRGSFANMLSRSPNSGGKVYGSNAESNPINLSANSPRTKWRKKRHSIGTSTLLKDERSNSKNHVSNEKKGGGVFSTFRRQFARSSTSSSTGPKSRPPTISVQLSSSLDNRERRFHKYRSENLLNEKSEDEATGSDIEYQATNSRRNSDALKIGTEKDHVFRPTPFDSAILCDFCSKPVDGHNAQAFSCIFCFYKCHTDCLKEVLSKCHSQVANANTSFFNITSKDADASENSMMSAFGRCKYKPVSTQSTV